MLVPFPSLDGDCLIKILRGEGHEVVEFAGNPFGYLRRGDLLPWEINRNEKYYEPQIATLFASVGLNVNRLQSYKDKYCGPHPKAGGERLN